MKKINKTLLLLLCVFTVASVYAMRLPGGMACCTGHFNDYIKQRIEYIEFLEKGASQDENRIKNLKDAMTKILEIKRTWDSVKVWNSEYKDIKPYKERIDKVFNTCVP